MDEDLEELRAKLNRIEQERQGKVSSEWVQASAPLLLVQELRERRHSKESRT